MTLRWGLLAAGSIAEEFAAAVRQSDHGTLAAVAARSADRAADFAARHEIPRSYGGYDELLADPEVDAVYVSTPHPMHAEWAIKAADAGKHVLCEKPLTVSVKDAEQVIEAARRNDVFLMEAFMYRLHPQITKLTELISAGAIGEVRAVDVTFSYDTTGFERDRIADPLLGGGGILDVGCYCVSLSRVVSQAATGIATVEPTDVIGMAKLDGNGVDEIAMGLLRLPGDIIAQMSCGFRLQQDDHIRVYGTRGQLLIDKPCWGIGMRPPGTSTIVLTPSGGAPETIEIVAEKGLFAREADHVAEHLAERQSPLVTWEDTLANLRTLERWRAAVRHR